jgi:alpha-amylase
MRNGTMLQCFHWYYPADGSLWNEIALDAKRLSELGITSVWLPPAFKANAGGYSVGYDVYDIYDLGEFDQKGSIRTKYGTKEEYLNAIKSLKNNNIDIYVDVVLNHLAGADEIERVRVLQVNEENRMEVIAEPEEIDAFTRFTFPGRKGKYSEFVWDKNCFTGVDYAQNKGEKGIYSIVNEFGEGWEEMVADEKGNYDYLMYTDVEFRNPAVREELKRWAKWYWDISGFDGVRLDAVKHISPKFYNEWLAALRAETGKEIFAVGEYWAPGDLASVNKYIEATEGTMSLFDASLHHNFHNASKLGKDFDLRTIFDGTLVASNPNLAVTLTDNHDTQPLQALEAPVEFWFKPLAYALILLREGGYPCIFYPDLYGAVYKGTGGNGNEHEIHLPIVPELEKLLYLRKQYAYGLQREYFDHANCIGFTRDGRVDSKESGCAVIISNGEEGSIRMEIGKQHAGKIFVDFLSNRADEVVIEENGWSNFFVNAGGVSVWVSK